MARRPNCERMEQVFQAVSDYPGARPGRIAEILVLNRSMGRAEHLQRMEWLYAQRSDSDIEMAEAHPTAPEIHSLTANEDFTPHI